MLRRVLRRPGLLGITGLLVLLGLVTLPDHLGRPLEPAGARISPTPSISAAPSTGYLESQDPLEDLDSAMPECAPYEVVPVLEHPENINEAPVENCDIRERPYEVKGPPKQPVAPGSQP